MLAHRATHQGKVVAEVINGEKQSLNATGLLAICIQHEIDHLNGIVFIEHLSQVKRQIALQKVRKYK